MRRRRPWLLLLVLPCLLMQASPLSVRHGGRSHAPGEPIIRMDSPSCTIPFIRAGNLIVIKGKVDTMEGNFILDTGAPGLVLNQTYFRNYPTRQADAQGSASDADGGGITGATGNSDGTTVEHFYLGPINYFSVDADRVNLGHIESSKGIRILGLLGMQLFTHFEMIVDYERSVISLHLITNKTPSDYRNEQLRDTSAYDEFPIDLTGNKVIVHTEMAGRHLLFLVDFGAESNVLDSRLPNKIFENVTVTQRVVLSGSGTKKVDALYGNLKNMRIGKRSLGELPVLVTNLQYMCMSYDHCLDGMFGFDFLSLHKIGFNFVKHKMYIWR